MVKEIGFTFGRQGIVGRSRPTVPWTIRRANLRVAMVGLLPVLEERLALELEE